MFFFIFFRFVLVFLGCWMNIVHRGGQGLVVLQVKIPRSPTLFAVFGVFAEQVFVRIR